MDKNRLSHTVDGRVVSYTPHPEYDRLLKNSQDGFPWGVVISRQIVAGQEIVKATDHMHPGGFVWHVDGCSFNVEAEAVIYAGLLSGGVDVNTAPRLAWGILKGFTNA